MAQRLSGVALCIGVVSSLIPAWGASRTSHIVDSLRSTDPGKPWPYPLAYNLRNLTVRKTTTIMTALGIALTVAVLLAVLALVNGLRSAFAASAAIRCKILVLRKGRHRRAEQRTLRGRCSRTCKSNPGIARDGERRPMASLEMVTVINLPSVDNTGGQLT